MSCLSNNDVISISSNEINDISHISSIISTDNNMLTYIRNNKRRCEISKPSFDNLSSSPIDTSKGSPFVNKFMDFI